jgi:hypothetical protein
LQRTKPKLPGQHREDEAFPFLPITQPSQDFGHNQLNGSALNMLLVLFSQHVKPEKALNNYLCSNYCVDAMVLFGMAYAR